MREQLIETCEYNSNRVYSKKYCNRIFNERLGIEDGTVLDKPLIEYCLKMIN